MSKSFVKDYISDLIKQIKKDSRQQKYQYKNMDPRDVNFQVDKLKEMKKDRQIEKVYSVPHLNGYAHPICLYSCHSIPCYKLLEAHFTVSGNKMTITNKILTNQRRPYK